MFAQDGLASQNYFYGLVLPGMHSYNWDLFLETPGNTSCEKLTVDLVYIQYQDIKDRLPVK